MKFSTFEKEFLFHNIALRPSSTHRLNIPEFARCSHYNGSEHITIIPSSSSKMLQFLSIFAIKSHSPVISMPFAAEISSAIRAEHFYSVWINGIGIWHLIVVVFSDSQKTSACYFFFYPMNSRCPLNYRLATTEKNQLTRKNIFDESNEIKNLFEMKKMNITIANPQQRKTEAKKQQHRNGTQNDMRDE